jgi:hypothetical protein
MTAQISDHVVYQGRPYTLVEVDGSGLFEPSAHGLQVRMMTTACHRGYVCEYAVEDGQLFLTFVQIGSSEPPEELFGAPLHDAGLAAQYGPLRVPQGFSGRLLLGAGFIHELYEHIGHHPAWKYSTVLELMFSNGQLEAVSDQCEAMAQRRAKVLEVRAQSRAEDSEYWVQRQRPAKESDAWAPAFARQFSTPPASAPKPRIALPVQALLWFLASLLGIALAQIWPVVGAGVVFCCWTVAIYLLDVSRKKRKPSP